MSSLLLEGGQNGQNEKPSYKSVHESESPTVCMYVCNEVSTRRSLASVACSGQLPRQGSFTNPMLQVPKSLGQSYPNTTGSRGTLCGTRRVGLWSFESSRSFVINRQICTHRRDPATAGRGHFDMLAFPPATGRSHTSPRGHIGQEC